MGWDERWVQKKELRSKLRKNDKCCYYIKEVSSKLVTYSRTSKLSGRAVSESDSSLRSSWTTLTCPPDSAAVLSHQVHDGPVAIHGDEVDDRIVTEAQFVHVVLYLFANCLLFSVSIVFLNTNIGHLVICRRSN